MDKIDIIWKRMLENTNNLENIDAKIINTDTVVTGMWTLLKCKYGCRNYKKSLGCPPYTPNAKEMGEVLESYSIGILFQTKDNMNYINNLILDLEYFALELEFYKAFALGAGRCRRCEECNLEGCIHPTLHRPSMEACGIDVQTTAKNNGYNKMTEIENGKKVYYCYGLLLID